MRFLLLCLGVDLLFTLLASPTLGQNLRRGGQEFAYLRMVEVPSDASGTIVVVEFYHHGQIDPQGKNVIVATGNQVVPARLLQLGPGDFCRLAFQTDPSRLFASSRQPYEILYGGDAFPDEKRPAWTANDGLLLEVREYRDCNLNSLPAVQAAFSASRVMGADYVNGVFQAGNPFTTTPGPYMSYYSGTLHVPQTGRYGFYTSSQDCSFLLVDGKVIAEAPGRHPPEYRARPDLRKDVNLTAGPHRFEYYHVATSENGLAVAAWEINPSGDKPAPMLIPPEAFRANAVIRAEAAPPSSQAQKFLPDFRFAVAGELLLPDRDIPLIGVRFTDRSPPPLVSSARIEWDFGDGQTAQGPVVDHVFLRPGIYAVKHTVVRTGRPYELVQRIWVGPSLRAQPQNQKPIQLDDMLPVLDSYRPETLDATSLTQLVLAFLTKADQYLPPPPPNTVFVDEEQATEQAKVSGSARRLDDKTRQETRRKYLQRALELGLGGLQKGSPRGDPELMTLARMLGTIARDVFGNAETALELWNAVFARVEGKEAKAEAALMLADIALNDLLQSDVAKKWLDQVQDLLQGGNAPQDLLPQWRRISADYLASKGDREAALAAYQEAERLVAASRNQIERTAWRGAHSRSTEDFLISGELDRAASELRIWQRDFPADTVEGYITLLFAKYWFARQRFDNVCALADRMSVINPYSPYIEELLLLSAKSDVARGQVERAKATLDSLIKDYRGSPLLDQAKEMRSQLEQKKTR